MAFQRPTVLRILTAIIAVLIGSAASSQENGLRSGGEETIDIELRTLPFYAVDRDGQPVYDLGLDELELAIDGRTIVPDVFDNWSHGSQAADDPTAPETERRSPPRHVFLFFDQAFSSPDGLRRSQRFAQDYLDELRDSDFLHLLTYHSQMGFRQLLGPVPATDKGKRTVRREVKNLRMNIERLRRNLGLPPPGPQQNWAYVQARNLINSEYRDAALDLAQAWEVLAAVLGQIQGQKLLLVFSGGIDSGLFLDGSYGLGPGSKPIKIYHGREWFFEPIRNSFEGPLRALAGSGTLPIFVNLQGRRTAGRSTLHHMSEATGGIFLEDGAPEVFERKIVASTDAYYEVGFYNREGLDFDGSPRIRLTSSRRGVRIHFPKRLKTRQHYLALSDVQKQFAIVDLIRRGQPGPSLTALHKLEGRVGKADPKGKQLLFEATWPEPVQGKRMDLYDVALRVRGKAEPELMSFDRRELDATPQPVLLRKSVPERDALIWGIVAVDPATGSAYVRRLMLRNDQDS